MKVLAIDTSGEQAGAAIVLRTQSGAYITAGEVMLNARMGEKSYTHSEILMPGVQRLFELTRLTPDCIDIVAYTSGPGSFTGLRIGASCALGMAKALNKPAIAVPTLCALAYNVLNAGGNAIVVPMLDARRNQVYTAVYSRDCNGQIERKSDFFALPIEDALGKVQTEITAQIHTDIIFLGDGADAYANAICAAFPTAIFAHANNNRQRAASAGVWAAAHNDGASHEVKLLYIRAPQAVREAKK